MPTHSSTGARNGGTPMADVDGPDLPELVAEAGRGRQEAWELLVRRFAPLVMAVCRQCGLARHDAEDVMQTVWLRLVEHLTDVREPRALPGWIKVTTRHESLRQASRSRRTGPVDALVVAELIADRSDPPDVDLIAAERHTALLEAMAELPENQRRLLELLTIDPPLPYSEIAVRLGIPIGSIGPTRNRALQRLRRNPILDATSERPQLEGAGG
jgi:RNA polymerase sigma factor (sigma-70 family)